MSRPASLVDSILHELLELIAGKIVYCVTPLGKDTWEVGQFPPGIFPLCRFGAVSSQLSVLDDVSHQSSDQHVGSQPLS